MATSVGPRPNDGRDAGSHVASDAVVGTYVVGDIELRFHAHSGAVARKLGREIYARRRRQPPLATQAPAFFVGRAEELRSVVTALSAGERIVLELTGRDGIGKTTFVRQLLTDPVVASLDGVVLAEGSTGRDDLLQKAFEAAYEGERRFMPTGAQRDQLLAEPRLLIVIDDFAGTEQDAGYLVAAAPSASFIFVTAAPKLGGTAKPLELSALNSDDAQALFARTMAPAQPLDSSKSLTAIMSATPLEIIQAASVYHDPSQAPIKGDLLLDRLVTTITATESVLLSGLVVTGGGPLSAKMIGRLGGLPNATPMLEGLERRGLVDFDGERYRLRPSILERVPITVTMPRLDGALAIFEEWLRGNPTTSQVSRRAQAANRLLARAVEDNRAQEVLVIGSLLGNALALAGEPDRARTTLDIVLKAARKLPDRDVEAWALHQGGTLAFATGDETAAQTILSRSLEIRERLNDDLATAATRHNLSMLLGVRPTLSSEEAATAKPKPNRLIVALLFALAAAVAVLFALNEFSRQNEPRQAAQPVHRAAAPAAAHREEQAAPIQGQRGAPAPVAAPVAHPRTVKHVAAKPKPKHHAAPRPVSPPSIASFYANPTSASAGEYAQLCFSIANATSATIDGIGAVSPRGSHCITIKPERSLTYTLTASNSEASARAFTNLSVTATMQVRPE